MAQLIGVRMTPKLVGYGAIVKFSSPQISSYAVTVSCGAGREMTPNQSIWQERYMRNHRRGSVVDGHADLHSELGPDRGEHSGRAINPTIKVDLAWLEFDKPDLKRAESFARDFGFVVAASKPDALYLRGSLPGTPAMAIRKGAHSRFVGPTFKAAEKHDLQRLAQATGTRVEPLDEAIEGSVVRLTDPSGFAVAVIHVDDRDARACRTRTAGAQRRHDPAACQCHSASATRAGARAAPRPRGSNGNRRETT